MRTTKVFICNTTKWLGTQIKDPSKF